MFYMFLADGFEETEALVTLDMLRRCNIEIKTVGISGAEVTGTHSITVKADITAEEFNESLCSGVILPGGMPGTENLFSCSKVVAAVKFCASSDRLVAAICAAPSVPGRLGLLRNKKAVCFPGFEKMLTDAVICNELCVRDGNFITAKGAGAVFQFSYEIIKYIKDEKTASGVLADIQYS